MLCRVSLGKGAHVKAGGGVGEVEGGCSVINDKIAVIDMGRSLV